MKTVDHVKQRIDEIHFKKSTLVAVSVGGTATFITLTVFFGLQWIFQELSFYRLLGAMQRSSTTLCFAGITSAATIMPLMLTVFGFAKNSKLEFPQSFYQRIKWIAWFCVVAFFSGLLPLTVLSSPVQEVGNVDPLWFRAIYYSVLAGLGIMVGSLGAIIIMLYYSILHIINSLNPHHVQQKEEKQKDNDEKKDV